MTQFKIGDRVQKKYNDSAKGTIDYIYIPIFNSAMDHEQAIVTWDNKTKYNMYTSDLTHVSPFKYPIGTKLKSRKTHIPFTIIDQQKSSVTGNLYNIMTYHAEFDGIKYEQTGIYIENTVCDYFYEVKE